MCDVFSEGKRTNGESSSGMKIESLAFCLHLKTSKTEEEKQHNFATSATSPCESSKVAKQMVPLHLNL